MKNLVVIKLILVLIFAFGCSEKENISLVKNGKTTYSIYMDPSAAESVRKAAEDLKSYFIKVTGASPEIIVTTQLPSTPFISLGNTSAAKAAGMDVSDIPNDGFRIVTEDRNIFIFGPDTPTGKVNSLGGVNNGTSNGVYTFIEDYLGVHWLMPGETGEAYTEVKTIRIPVVDRLEFSPFDYRVVWLGSQRSPLVKEWEKHLKLGEVAAVEHNHSWKKTIPPSLFDVHPDWFAHKDGQPIPPTETYKLETTNHELVKAYADTIIKIFRNNPDQRWYSLSPSDGGSGWSDSPAAKALLEEDPYGKLSRTPLIFKFYNDVAKIVGLEFPDHKLCGYLYNDYRWPPSGNFYLEPNIVFMLVGHTHHYRLFRTSDRLYRNYSNAEINDELIRSWSEIASTHNFDLYFYDYPIWMRYRGQETMDGLIWPPTPENLNFIFSRLAKYNYKGAFIYGNNGAWPAFGVGNYIIAKLFWNPGENANELLIEYCNKAYGTHAAPYIIDIYNVLDTAFNYFYNKNIRAGSSMTIDHLKEIYAPNYERLEEYYLKAYDERKTSKEQDRLVLLGQILALMQNTLKVHGFIPSDYKSFLTLSPEEINTILSTRENNYMEKFEYFNDKD